MSAKYIFTKSQKNSKTVSF